MGGKLVHWVKPDVSINLTVSRKPGVKEERKTTKIFGEYFLRGDESSSIEEKKTVVDLSNRREKEEAEGF